MPRRHRSGRERPRPEPVRRPGGVAPPGMHLEGWTVRQSSKGGAPCPYCNRETFPGKDHIVAWPDGEEDRRKHWHMECWRRELRGGGPP